MTRTSLYSCFRRTTFAEDETEGQVSGRETSQDGVQRRAAVPVEEGVQRKPIPDGEEAPGTGQRTGSERGPDKDMVPEQTGQDQEVERLEKSVGPSADGPGTVQSHHGGHVRRRDGRPTDRHVVVIKHPVVPLMFFVYDRMPDITFLVRTFIRYIP